jgi:hypothetical protein
MHRIAVTLYNRPREPPAGRTRRPPGVTVLKLTHALTVLATQIKLPTYPIHKPGRRYKMLYTHENGERS